MGRNDNEVDYSASKRLHMITYRDVSPGNHYGMSDKTALSYMKMRTELSGSGPMAGD